MAGYLSLTSCAHKPNALSLSLSLSSNISFLGDFGFFIFQQIFDFDFCFFFFVGWDAMWLTAQCYLSTLDSLIATYNLESYTSITPLPFQNEMKNNNNIGRERRAASARHKMDHPIILFFSLENLGWNKKEKRSKNWCIQFFEI
jgi:hypothetical protein